MSNTLDLNQQVSRDALTVPSKEDSTVLSARLEEQFFDAELRREKEFGIFDVRCSDNWAGEPFLEDWCASATMPNKLDGMRMLFLVGGDSLAVIGLRKSSKYLGRR